MTWLVRRGAERAVAGSNSWRRTESMGAGKQSVGGGQLVIQTVVPLSR